MEAAASPSGRQPTTESAEKLDALMGLVFEHLGRRCEVGQLHAAWATTLHTFQRTILHTHRSKFTQYLLWYLCEKARPLPLPFLPQPIYPSSTSEVHAVVRLAMRRSAEVLMFSHASLKMTQGGEQAIA